ncbi:hypothetical protein D3C71_1844020 [compost metagenome]
MPGNLFIHACTSVQDLRTLSGFDSGAVVVHLEQVTVSRALDTQAHLAFRPFTGVIQQVAEQFEHVLAIPG